jgi:hypothetical protein
MKTTLSIRSVVVTCLGACSVLGVMVAGQAQGATIRYQGSGDYFATTAIYTTYGWQGSAVPGALDTIRFNWGNNTVTLAGAAPTVTAFQMGVDESGKLVVNSGGSLSSSGTSTIGNNAGNGGANPTTGSLIINAGGVVNNNGGYMRLAAGPSTVLGNLQGVLTLNGGTLNDAGHLWVGSGNLSIGTIDINNGGILNVGGMLGLGTLDSTSASGGFGFLNVNDGGVLNLANIQATALGSIQPGSLLDIDGSGRVTIPGNFVSVMNGYIGAGRITGNDVVGNVETVFDAGQNMTFLTAIPVPEPSALALMTFMAVGLLARRVGRKSWK